MARHFQENSDYSIAKEHFRHTHNLIQPFQVSIKFVMLAIVIITLRPLH